jgi:WD40 repeat protein/serine/threonine protein kinase
MKMTQVEQGEKVAAMDNLSGQTIKGYELREQIGAGGFGAVYRADQPLVGREVAVKVILPKYANQPDFIRRFEFEAQLIARLEHLHIVPLYDYWRDAQGAYLVMRWLRGGNLLTELKRSGALDLARVALLLDQVAAALTIAHRSQIIHRDLKPANILLDEEGNSYLSDFGIAKDVGQHETGITGAEMIVGSPDYISPEQARSEPVTPQTDIYALGVMLYEMLTGEHPFPDASSMELLFKHIHEPIPWIDTLPEGINDVIQKATAKKPAQRFGNAVEMAAAFREAAALGEDVVVERLEEDLTPREQEILALLVAGQTNQEIADELVLEIGTVKWHLRNVYRKLGAKNRVQAIVRARDLNLITPSPPVEAAVTMVGMPDVDQATLPPVALVNPYKGLRAFQEADAADFFGRKTLIDRLIARLADDKQGRFLAVIGPSGSGKSSVVKAGLIPALREGPIPGSEKAFIVEMYPGTHPLEELEAALLRVAVNPPGSLIDQLRADERGLNRAVKRILPADESTELILIIDQFEEVFTLVEDEARRAHFLDSLLAAIREPRSRLRIVITLRADFYDRPLLYPDFGELVRQNMETVMPLTPREIEAAVVNPAKRVGVIVDSELVKVMVNDVGEKPGTLPLLQYALTELFERRVGRSLTLAAYHGIGGVLGALARRADEIYDDLDDAGQEITRQVFLRLVALGEGTEDTRRRVRRSEFSTETGQLDDVIDAFGDARLLTFDRDPITRGPTLEMAHEALIQQWTRLREWLAASREDVRLHRRLTLEAQEWIEAHRDAGFLATGARLDQYAVWAEDADLRLNLDEQAYLDDSLDHREALRARDEARKAHEAELERRAIQRLRYLVAALSLFLLVAAGLTIFAFGQQNNANNARATSDVNAENAATQAALAARNAATSDANAVTATIAQGEAEQRATEAFHAQATSERRADESHSLALAIQAQQIDPVDHSLALALAVEANAIDDPPALARLTLGELAFAPGMRRSFEGHTAPAKSAAFSPDGQTVASASGDHTVKLWDVASGDLLKSLDGLTDSVESVTFSPDGQTVISASYNGTVQLWDVASGALLYSFDGHTDGVASVAFSPDGQTVVSGSYDGMVQLWDMASGALLHSLEGHTDRVMSVAFSPDGRTIASASVDGTVKLWDVGTGALLHSLDGHTDGVVSVAFSPDGQTVVSGSYDGTIQLWDVASGDLLHSLGDNTDRVRGVAFSPDGQTVVSTSSNNGIVKLWDVASGILLHSLDNHTDWLASVAFSPDSRTIVSGSITGMVQLWDVASGTLLQAFGGHTDGVWGVAFSPDGRTVVSASDDHTVKLWDVTYSTLLHSLDGHTALVSSVAFSPDGQTIASGSYDDTVKLWDVDSGALLHSLDGHTDGVWSVAFSPDGQTIASTSFDDSVKLWDVDSGALLYSFDTQPEVGLSVAFSPDGQTLVSGSAGDTISLWDVSSGALLHSFNGPSALLHSLIDYMDPVLSMAFSPDGQTLVSGSQHGTVRLMDVGSGELLHFLIGHTDPVWSVAFSPDGQTIASGSHDNSVKLWDVDSGTLLHSLDGHANWVTSVAFSPDGQTIASASFDDSVKLWDVASGTLLHTLEGHTSQVLSVVFSPDGQTVVSAARDNSVKLWDVASGVLRHSFDGHTLPVWCVVISPDGQTAASGSLDGTVKLWDLAIVDDPVGWIYANRVVHEFTCFERKRFLIEPYCTPDEEVLPTRTPTQSSF